MSDARIIDDAARAIWATREGMFPGAERLSWDAATQIARDAATADARAAFAVFRWHVGCARGQRTTQWCAEVEHLRRAWLGAIQAENGCVPSGAACPAKRCGCLAEQSLLIREASRHD